MEVTSRVWQCSCTVWSVLSYKLYYRTNCITVQTVLPYKRYYGTDKRRMEHLRKRVARHIELQSEGKDALVQHALLGACC